jgi:endo-1,4-beta-xylanase
MRRYLFRVKKNTNMRLLLIMTFVLIAVFSLGCKKNGNDNKGIQDSVEDTSDLDKEKTESNIDEIKDKNDEIDGTADKSDDNEGIKEENLLPAIHYGNVEVEAEIILSEDFESGESSFAGRGSAITEIISDKANTGSNSLFTTERTAHWNGPIIELTDKIIADEIYTVKAYVFYEDGPDSVQIDCMIELNGNQYFNVGSTMANKGVWTELNGRITIPNAMETVSFYFENRYDAQVDDIKDFYIDDFVITREKTMAVRGDIPAIKDVYKDYFTIGVAATIPEAAESRQGMIKEQFNSFTTGNELKPDSLLDYEKCISDPKFDDNPQITFKNAKFLMDFAQEAGIPMRGHTLVWHAQTPRWFFTEGYSKDVNAPFVSKELMLRRLENYIKNVLEYSQTNYPGLIYAWDVVNEAIEVSDGNPGGYRSKDSNWYQVIGDEFLEKAFEYARKYADPEVKLFYNDYNTEQVVKMHAIKEMVESLKQKGLIDGIGLQCHLGNDSPSIADIEYSIKKYAETGLEIHITELDMGLTDNSEEEIMKQGSRYKRLFLILKYLKDKGFANITNVTFWGMSDDISWLNKPGIPNYPLLFDKYLVQKPAFWGAIQHPDIPLN